MRYGNCQATRYTLQTGSAAEWRNVCEREAMEPVFGFGLYAVATMVVWVVASKRGRRGWLFALACVALAPPLVMVVARIAGSLAAGWAAFAVPLVVLLASLAMRTGEQMAAQHGAYRGLRRCPHCAESIKAAARVCKHCGRESTAIGS